MASDLTEQKCADVDYQNVVKGVMDVVDHSRCPTPSAGKAKQGMRTSNPDILGKAKSKLQGDLVRLVTSPHTQAPQVPEITLSANTVTALRDLWSLLQEIKSLDPSNLDSKEADLKAAVHRAVTSLDPTHIFEATAAAKDQKAPDQETRKSQQRVAAKQKKRYQEDEDGDNEEDLIGEDMDE
ncbi:hypothetical protein G6011_02204 [Alternaria panax]|uniref:Uncharacterized protein n=1 Tax=Alternaria panax TaxID=48097 RepID=A0AAD4FGH9_9PLEO|nr:hypothetical protein G6011_02204 [Alternaria panax]